MADYGFIDLITFNWIIKQCKKVDLIAGKLKLTGGKSATRVSGSGGFWAVITGVDDSTARYSWAKLKPQADESFSAGESPFGQYDDWGTGNKSDDTGYAYEINGSTEVVLYDKVWIEPNGLYDYYTFFYAPTGKLVKAQESIPAISSDTMTYAICDIYHIEKTGGYSASAGTYSPTARRLKGYNMSNNEIAADVFLQAKYVDGFWLVDVEACT